MMRKYFYFFLFPIFLLTVSAANAQLTQGTTKVGTTVAQFLKIGAGARSLGMGGTAAAIEGDVYSMYWNPGALARVEGDGAASFTHAAWLADINFDYAAAALSIGDFGVVGISVTSLGVPQDIVRTEDHPYGDGRVWDASDFALGVTYARALTDRFSIGASFKYIRQGIWNESAQGVAVDIGTIYTTQFNDLKIGASISNFGTKMRLQGPDLTFNNTPEGELGQGPQNIPAEYATDSYDLPLSFRLGLSMDIVKSELMRTTVAVDATHPNDNSEYINSGIEFGFRETFFARVGYKSLFMPNSEEGLTWGAGVNAAVSSSTMIKVDYAFASYGRLENVQYVSLTVTY
ncbi:MAG: PorV/PorQ family protein [Bacteroidota bacterium]|nr:PorV/PorQ family protein [Bacteroidota bacterium]